MTEGYVDRVHPGQSWRWDTPYDEQSWRHCSYCGSMDPEFVATNEAITHIEWADYKYGWPHKFYANVINHESHKLYVIGSMYTRDDEAAKRRGYVDIRHRRKLTGAQRDALDRYRFGGRRPNWVTFGHRDMLMGKFYTVHLAEDSLDPALIDAVEKKCGLRFTFRNGKVGWKPYDGDV
jgi:hypothetical protein